MKWIIITVMSLTISIINSQSLRRTNSRAKKSMQVTMRIRTTIPSRKEMARQDNFTRKGGKAYIVGDWLTDIDPTNNLSSCDNDHDDDEKVVTLAIKFSFPSPSPSSSTHLCHTTKDE
jgi:hypothetical protein